MVNKVNPTVEDWNRLLELKAFANRDAETAKLCNEFFEMFNWEDYTYIENGKVGLKNIFGKILIPADFDEIVTKSDVYNGYIYLVAIVKRNDKYSLALRDGSGRTLTSFLYDEIKQLSNEFYSVLNNGKYGIVNDKGFTIMPCVLEDVDTDVIELPFDVVAVLKKNDKYGFILRYTIIGYLGTPTQITKCIQPMYEDWSGQEFNHFKGTVTGDLKVKLNGEWGYLDKDACFTTSGSKSYIGDEFRYDQVEKERFKYFREKWWREHPEEDRDIYYMDDSNFDL